MGVSWEGGDDSDGTSALEEKQPPCFIVMGSSGGIDS